ncbi:MAG: elongation factor G [Victivallaceae bacterium]|nr:elongation factor G [Victivallaceae bacterium]
MRTQVGLETIRNIGIIAHIDAGKTTLTERFLFYSGKTHRIGDIDSGNTVMDYLDEERSRGITIVSAAATFPWADSLIHLIDTPGHIDFTAEVERSIRVCDGAVVIFSGVEGVEAQSEKVWRQSDAYQVSKLAFINKLDRLGASFERTLADIKQKFTAVKIIPVQLPDGAENEFKGLVDLLRMQYLRFGGEDGSEVFVEAIPAELMEQSNAAREQLLADVAELSEIIAEFYLEEREIPLALLKTEIRRLVMENKLCPILAGSAKKNVGVQPLLDAVIDYLPSPADRPVYPALTAKNHEKTQVHVDDPHFCGLIFKIIASGSADLLYLRSYSGRLKVNDFLINSRTGSKVRIKRILRLYAKNVDAIDEVGPGDIVGIIGPDEVFTGDTLCDHSRQVLLNKITFPEPVISMALETKSVNDKDRLQSSLTLMCREDPTLEMEQSETTGQLILSGMGELHLEICTHRLQHEFNLNIRYGKPRVAFRETLLNSCSATGIFDKMIGDRELYSEVDIDLEPARLIQGMVINSTVRGHELPKSWLQTAQSTLAASLKTGGNRGYALIYIKATITAIRGTVEKTTDGAVAGAVIDAVNQAIRQGTKLMEPIMKLDITAPEETVGEITGYLQMRRCLITGIDSVADSKVLHCEVPLAEMFGFSTALPKLSGGRAAFSMEPFGYQEISPDDLQRLGNNHLVSF